MDSSLTFSTLLRSFLSLSPCSSILFSILAVRSGRPSTRGSSSAHSASSMARTSSALLRTAFTFASSFDLFFSTLPFHTNVYLFATDSIFVPSMYCTFRDTSPSPFSNSTTWRNTSSNRPSDRRSLLKRLIVLKSGRLIPDSHM